jgi:chromosome segregation ATPase
MVEGLPEAENMGPLQAEIHNLGKAIAVQREACEALQRRWLADQTTLVAAANDAEVKGTRLREMASQAVLLNQKRIRLDAAIEAQRSEQRRLEAATKVMHDDMARINGLIAKNGALAQKLAAASYTTQRAFGEELRELERECAAADARVASLAEEKGRLVEEVLECERQVVLWEKKITLERETQEALDPSIGESELAGMEKEIHRMRLRHDALKRDQERLVAEMERAIEKRDVIALKHRSAKSVTLAAASSHGRGVLGGGSKGAGLAATNKGGSGDAQTRVGLRHRAAALRQDIATRLAQAEEVEAAIAARGAEVAALQAATGERGAELAGLEARAGELQRGINTSLYEKQKGVEHASALARMLQRFEALEAGRLPPLTADEAAHVRERLREAEAARDGVRAMVAALAAQHTELAEVLDRVAQLTDIAPTA